MVRIQTILENGRLSGVCREGDEYVSMEDIKEAIEKVHARCTDTSADAHRGLLYLKEEFGLVRRG